MSETWGPTDCQYLGGRKWGSCAAQRTKDHAASRTECSPAPPRSSFTRPDFTHSPIVSKTRRISYF